MMFDLKAGEPRTIAALQRAVAVALIEKRMTTAKLAYRPKYVFFDEQTVVIAFDQLECADHVVGARVKFPDVIRGWHTDSGGLHRQANTSAGYGWNTVALENAFVKEHELRIAAFARLRGEISRGQATGQSMEETFALLAIVPSASNSHQDLHILGSTSQWAEQQATMPLMLYWPGTFEVVSD